MNDSKERDFANNKPDIESEERFKRDQIEKESGGAGLEEYAAEIAPPAMYHPEARGASVRGIEESDGQEAESAQESRSYRWLGYTALLLSIISLFIFPALLGSISALLGFFAYMLGLRALGAWSVAIGLISLAGYLFLVPMYA